MKIRRITPVLLLATILSNKARSQVAAPAKPEIVVQTGHASAISQLRFSPDGRLVASTTLGENVVKLWQVESGRQLRNFTIEGGNSSYVFRNVGGMAFSGHDELFAGMTQDEVDVWNIQDGERVYRFPLAAGQQDLFTTPIEGAKQPLSLSASGKLLAWAAEGRVELRDLGNRGQPIAIPLLDASRPLLVRIVALTFSRDERELVVFAGVNTVPSVRIVDVASGAMREATKVERETVFQPGHLLGVSAAGHLVVATNALVSAGGMGIRIHDINSGELFDLNAIAASATMSGNGTLMAVHSNKKLEVWDIGSKQKLFSYAPDSGSPTYAYWAADFSEDGKMAVGDNSGAIHILDAHSGKERGLLVGHSNVGGALAFDDGSTRLYAGGKTIWDLKSGIGLRTVPGKVGVRSLAARNGTMYAEDAGQGTVKIWDLSLGNVTATLSAQDEVVQKVAFSPDGSLLAIVRQEDFSKPEVQVRAREHARELAMAYLKARTMDPTQAYAALYDPANPSLQIKVYDSHTGAEKFTLSGHSTPITALAFSDDGTRIASAATEGVKIWSAADGKLISSVSLSSTNQAATSLGFPGRGYSATTALAFSPDGRSLAAALYTMSFLYNGAPQQQMPGPSRAGGPASTLGIPRIPRKRTQSTVIVSRAGYSTGATISAKGPVLLVDLASSRPVTTLTGHSNMAEGVAFSSDGKLLATSGMDGFIRIWETSSGSLAKELPSTTAAMSLAFTNDGKVLASSQNDGTTALWEVESGARLATLVSLYDGADWLVATPEGLFDGSPAAWNQILWRYSRNTFDVAPVESFFSEYFYPGLLADIMAGKRPKPPQQINEKDRRQPEVQISAPENGGTVADREVSVTIRVTEAPPSENRAKGSGARDLRLFRNGSLVKVWHGDLLNGKTNASFEAKVRIVAGQNRLTAYAFNHENVKSRDAELVVTGAPGLFRAPTTYVLAVGINEYENADYNLRLAVADAESVAAAIQREQAKAGRVEVIPLYNQAATRSAILDAISKLASITQPEDHVILFFASHGTAEHDRFYLIPYDLGFKGKRTELDEAGVQQILTHSISDRDLEQTLEGLDAGQVVVIMDACNSGQALEAEEKRRGPMNSRGLAQLAYEKGMYILTAAQSYQAALEVSQLGHGLLTYSLVAEGLEEQKADDDPRDGKIVDREWLSYATKRVPELQLDTLRSWKSAGRAISFEQGSQDSSVQGGMSQRPKLFYRRELNFSPWVISGNGAASDATQTR